MKRLAVAAATTLLALFYRICRLFPVKRQVVCISRQSNDAPIDFLLLKEGLARKEPPYRTVILADKLESPLRYLPVMAKQVFFIATSRAVVVDSYCIVVSLLGSRIKAPVVQIWHALGNMKKFGYATLDTPEGHRLRDGPSHAYARGVRRRRRLIAQLPRRFGRRFQRGSLHRFRSPPSPVDLLRDPAFRSRQREAFLREHPKMAGKKTIVYCPTFRKTPPPNEEKAMQNLLSAVDFDEFNFVFLPHPVSRQTIDDPRVITADRSGIDPLFAADYVITDYSTVMYEAGLLGVPVFLYAYDWGTYHEKRSFNIDLARDVPTLFTDDPSVLVKAIERDAFEPERYQCFVRNNITLPTHGTCTNHLCRYILKLVQQTDC